MKKTLLQEYVRLGDFPRLGSRVKVMVRIKTN